MKIELNPNRMTIDELNDCISELTAQRDRLIERDRQNVLDQCHDAVIKMLGEVWTYTDCDQWDVELHIKPTHGREHRINLAMAEIEEWHIEVTRPE